MTTLQQEFDSLTMAPAVHFQNMTVLPLLRTNCPPGGPDYLLLEEAVHQGFARVLETNGGSVSEICFENHSERPVLLLDGEEVIGAKQDRALNLTILAPPKATITIPVSCVEAGRWSMSWEPFKPARRVLFSEARRKRAAHVTESIWRMGVPRSDQSALWEEIAGKSARMGASSPTQALGALFARHEVSLEQYVRAFPWQEGQAGLIFAIGGVPFGLDLLDHPATMRKLLPGLIQSYALDALDFPDATTDPAGSEQFDEFLRRLAQAPVFTRAAVGLGKDVRITGDGMTGAALWAEERYIHVCGFRSDSELGLQTRWRARFNRPTRRRSA